jgi:hypothetical protein
MMIIPAAHNAAIFRQSSIHMTPSMRETPSQGNYIASRKGCPRGIALAPVASICHPTHAGGA